MKILNLQNPARSDIQFERFCFPDGQFHVKLTSEVGFWEHVQVIQSINYQTDVLVLGLAVNALRTVCKGRISVNIPYMMGARMDRRIGEGQPFSLHVYASLLNAACQQANEVRILDPHSEVTTNQVFRSTAVLPAKLFFEAMSGMYSRTGKVRVVVPDAGARPRMEKLAVSWPHQIQYSFCGKKRDSETGALSGFYTESSDLKGQHCLIVDDICDGGGTFAGLSTVLREAGAARVDLCVTHGIFSKGVPIPGIDMVYTTDSYSTNRYSKDKVTVLENYFEDWVRSPK